ncbi:hypothetical protein EDB85DRAFT_1903478 [Lactarius pseudohatsudake]|nr:hypothetical protein EDB85DRAFT_1903478 [Lactarius pseudohatsudake]
MGSVQAGGMWSKVQCSQRLLIGHMEEHSHRRTPAPPADEDDGSGMGWVKRRHEELDHNITTITLSQPTPENDDDEEDEEETKYDLLDDESSGMEQDNDNDAEEQHFKQVLGAGMEHVSRHRTLTTQKLHDDSDDMKVTTTVTVGRH